MNVNCSDVFQIPFAKILKVLSNAESALKVIMATKLLVVNNTAVTAIPMPPAIMMSEFNRKSNIGLPRIVFKMLIRPPTHHLLCWQYFYHTKNRVCRQRYNPSQGGGEQKSIVVEDNSLNIKNNKIKTQLRM